MTIETTSTVSEPPLKRPLAACRQHLVYAASVSAAINLLYLAPTLYMLQVYDRVVPTRGLETLGFLTFLLLVSLTALSLLEFMRTRLMVRASVRLERRLAGPILAQILARSGDAAVSQAMREFDILRQAVTGAGMMALFDAPWILVYIALCFLLNPLVGAVAVVGAVALTVLTIAAERATRPRLDAANQAASLAYASQAQSGTASEVLRAMGMGPAIVERHRSERSEVTRMQAQASFAAGGYLGVTRFIRMSLQSLALGLAALLAVEGQISAGAIFAASLLVVRALGPIEQILASWKSLVEAHYAYNSLKKLGEDGETETPRTLLPAPLGNVTAEQVTILGPKGRRPLLHGVDLVMRPGEVVGLVGPSGAGKTTLLRALVGAATPNHGQVRIDGADIADWPHERLGRHIGYLPQDLGLLQGTVKQNICRFRDQLGESPETLDALAVAAAQACGAHDMILRLPQGYDTQIGFGGQGVSLGQAQRIALARALFGEPAFIALDEPNAHLDAEGEAMLIRALLQARERGASVIVVAHRNGLLEAIDELLVINEGRLVQRGPRDEVLQRLSGPPKPVQPMVADRRSA